MKITDKLIQEFDLKHKTSEIEGYMPDSMSMLIQEFSMLYEIKKYILAKELV